MKTLKSIPSFLLICGLLFATELSAQFSLKVKGVEKKCGSLRVAIFDSEAHFLDENHAVKRSVYPINTGDELIQIKGLEVGKSYAIAVYHDKNNNGHLDTNLFGVPVERYGFSNDARGTFGPPAYAEAKFLCNKHKTLTIHIK